MSGAVRERPHWRWDWIAEFESAEAAVRAARRLREQGYGRLEIFSPFEAPGAAEALGLPRPRRLPLWVLVGGLLGAACAYAIQWYADAVSFPIDVGGRPLHPAPAFVPITFEGGVLLGAFAALTGLLFFSRLPRPWQPVFEVGGFESASIAGFWLALGAEDSGLDAERGRADLEALAPLRVERVEAEE